MSLFTHIFISFQLSWWFFLPFFQFQAETEIVNDPKSVMELEMPAESAVRSVRKQNQDYLSENRKGGISLAKASKR